MAYLKGTIKDGEKVLIENIDIKLSVNNNAGMSSWNGYFNLPLTANMNFQKLYLQNPGDSFDLLLENNRGGKFHIPNLLINSGTDTWIYFEGTGQLEKSN